MTKTSLFTDANSRKLRLAGATVAKIATFVEKQGSKLPADVTTPRAAIKWCKEQGWAYKGNVVNQAKKDEYGAAQSCGDAMAEAFSRHVRSVNPDTKVDFLDLPKLREVAKVNGVSMDRWLHLNIGQMRMNLGNVLRGKVNRGERVTVGDKTWNKDAKVEAPKAKAPKAKAKKAPKAKAPKAKTPKTEVAKAA